MEDLTMNRKPATWPLDRRTFLQGAAVLAGTALLSHRLGSSATAAEPLSEVFSLPPLPYAEDALAPHISSDTVRFHYGKHHKGYIDKLNQAIQGTSFVGLPLPEIIKQSAGRNEFRGIFNNAAQVWNHTFYWQSLKPKSGPPEDRMAQKIVTQFGGIEPFKKEFAAAAGNQFGSGWAWLAQSGDGSLSIVTTANAENPLTRDLIPLFTLDVWEHAYYLDYQNRRGDYLTACLDHLINWEFAAANLIR